MLDKRRRHYKGILKENSRNYDIWFDLVLLEESIDHNNETIEETYQQIQKTHPQIDEKKFWKKYIYLNLSYATFLEITKSDLTKAIQVVSDLVALLHEKGIKSKKIWIFGFKQFIRNREITKARQFLGRALGINPHQKLFRNYIEFEAQLGNFDRCEKLYKKWLQTFPDNSEVWEDYLDYNKGLDKRERVEAIFRLGVSGKFEVTHPEKIYKKYIDINTEWGEHEKVRQAFTELLKKTDHVKVFLACAHFESSIGNLQNMRDIFSSADESLKGKAHMKEERALLLRSWLDLEQELQEGSEWVNKVVSKMPKKVRKQRQMEIETEDGKEIVLEEFYDFVFPDELDSAKGLKLLEMAKLWQHNKGTLE